MMNDQKKFVTWAEACKMTQDGPKVLEPSPPPGTIAAFDSNGNRVWVSPVSAFDEARKALAEASRLAEQLTKLIGDVEQLRAEARELKKGKA